MTSSHLLRAPSFHSLHSLASALARGLTLLLALALTLASVHARAEQGIITPVSYATTVDLVAGAASFAIRFDRAPDFQAVDSFGTLRDDSRSGPTPCPWTRSGARSKVSTEEVLSARR